MLQIGLHDEIFYKTLDGLNKEYDELRAKGYSGEGFVSDGSRLGVSHNLPRHEARAKAIAEAERRHKLSKVMGPAGGRTLGGTTARGKSAFKSPRELMLDAAERRARDAKSCGHGDALSMEAVAKELEKATQASVSHIIDNHALPPDFDEEPPPMAGKRAKSPAPSTESDGFDIEIIEKPIYRKVVRKVPSQPSKGSPAAPVHGRQSRSHPTSNSAGSNKRSNAVGVSEGWSCEVCTFENTKSHALACEMCGSERSSTDGDWRDEAGWQQVDDVRDIATGGAYGKITHNKHRQFGW